MMVESYNEENHTIEVVFATEIEVERRSWDGTRYIEVLECQNANVRLDRAASGINLVDSHHTYTVNDILGRAEKVWVKDGQCRALIKLTKREDKAGIIEDIKSGIIGNISVGYRIHKTEVTEDNEKNTIMVRVTDWEPMELSVLSVPADYTAGVRSGQENQVTHFYEISNSRNMPQEEEVVQTTENPTPAATEANRSAQPQGPASTPAPAAAPAANTQDAVVAERTRITEITNAVRSVGIQNQEFLDGLISRGVSAAEANTEIINHLATNQPQVRGHVIATGDSRREARIAGMENAIAHRANPSVELTEAGREFRGLNLLDMARTCAEDANISTRGLSRREIAQAAMNVRSGMHSTSDFPLILGSAVNRALTREYAIQGRTFTQWAQRGTARDFREINRISLGDFDDLKEVKEGGEYQYGTIGEGAEKYKVVKYGRKVAITWESIINDDLDAFSRIPRKIAATAARKQSDMVYAILTGSHKMADGKDLFHADHKNLISTGTAIAIDSIGKMRALIRNQKTSGGKDVLDIMPRFIIVGPDNEQLALQYTSASFMPNVAGNQNVWAGLVTPIVENRITGNQWFMAVDPAQLDTVEYSFLEGEPELFTEQKTGWDVDGIEIKARMVFGCKALDYRGLAKNAGQ